jgi:hypothetical protein
MSPMRDVNDAVAKANAGPDGKIMCFQWVAIFRSILGGVNVYKIVNAAKWLPKKYS